MSVRTWNAGNGQNWALFVMMIFWTLLILLGIVQSDWQLGPAAVFGLVFVICILYSWVWFFMHPKKPQSKPEVDR
jgi:hypothetical protein